MIPVMSPVRTASYKSPVFTCVHCRGVFRKRGPNRMACVDCQDEVERQKSSAHQRLYYRIKKGLIALPSDFACVDCGEPASRYDHRRYDEPYNVEPVCCSCNGKRGPAILGPRK
jgi:hypothetical protein